NRRDRALRVGLIVVGERVAAGNAVLLAQPRVELRVELVAVNLLGGDDRQNASFVGRVDADRQWIQGGVCKKRLRHRVDNAVGGKDAACEKLAGTGVARVGASLRVADVHAKAGKVAGSPGRRRHGDGTAAARALNDPLIVNEEEELVLHYGAAQRPPED